jgi:hypothetical protein
LTPKRLALSLLALVSLAAPFLERVITGRVEPFGQYELAATFISLPLIYWWYHADKAQHNYRAGPLMNGGVIILAIVALPVYFIRSRGWKRGAVATLLAALFLAVTLALGELGEYLGALISP